MLREVFDSLLSLLFPRHCPCCDSLTVDGAKICKHCREALDKVRLGSEVCIKCGLPFDQCVCGRTVFLFEGIVAPFKYEGAAARGVLGIKKNSSCEAADFFAEEAVAALKRSCPERSFDTVCPVPMHSSKRRMRDFDHTELLARREAELLGLPFEALLEQTVKSSTQHTLSYDRRRENVRNIYRVRDGMAVKGKKILLIDDIKTSGATLNECAHVLLKEGAASVFCLTAAVTCKKALVNR